MSTSRGKRSFSELMARHGFDPRGEHPELKPARLPVYVKEGEWDFSGIHQEPVEDDRGYGPEESEDLSWMDGQ